MDDFIWSDVTSKIKNRTFFKNSENGDFKNVNIPLINNQPAMHLNKKIV